MKKTLLWIAVLPGALIGAIAIGLIAKFIIQFWQGDWWGIHWIQRVYFYLVWVIQSFLSPIGFVWAGMRIAPSYKRETGLCLIGIAIMYTVVIIILDIVARNTIDIYTKSNILYLIFQTLGIVSSFMFLPTNDEQFKEIWETPKKDII